jgi:hypothetical protein
MDRRGRNTILAFILAMSCVAAVSGVLVASSAEVARTVVHGLAWIKGVSLDDELYGISRFTLWQAQLRRWGSALSAWGTLVGLCAFTLRCLRDPRTDVLRGLAFGAGLLVALWVRPMLTLPFQNPLGIVGPLAELRQNPGNSILQYLLLVVVPAAAVALFDIAWTTPRLRGDSGHPHAFAISSPPGLLAALATITLVVLVAGDAYTWHEQVPLDTFHEGESMAPAVRWEHGQAPYRDFILVHGPFQDPLRAILAFNVFGRSIAAVRTVESLLQIGAVCLFALLILSVFEWDIGTWAVASAGLFFFLCVKPFAVGFTVPHRDITLYLFLLSAIALFRLLRRERGGTRSVKTFALFFICAAIPFASFAYSVDRGLYLTMSAIVALPLLLWLFARRGDGASFAAIAAGAAVGVLCLGLSIRWAFPEFISHVFVFLPEFYGLGFSLPYPFESTWSMVPIVLTSFNASWLTHRLITQCRHGRSVGAGIRDFAESTFVEILLFELSVVFYRSALGRAAPSHIYYSAGLIFLLTSVILIRHIGREALAQFSSRHGLLTRTGVVLGLAGMILYLAFYIDTSRWFRFPLGAPDDKAIQPNYRNAMAFLRDSLSTQSRFLTLTSEGMWEYFIGRPSPTRFPVVVFALPTIYQEEIVRDMELRHIDVVLFTSDHWANAIDGISFEKRLPVVARYMVEHYEPYRRFEDQQVWKRRQGTGEPRPAPSPVILPQR